MAGSVSATREGEGNQSPGRRRASQGLLPAAEHPKEGGHLVNGPAAVTGSHAGLWDPVKSSTHSSVSTLYLRPRLRPPPTKTEVAS